MIVFQKPFERVSPNARRNFQTLSHNSVEVSLRNRLRERALLKIEREGRINRIGQRRNGALKFRHARIVPEVEERRHQHKPQRAIRVIHCEAFGDVAAHRMTGDHRAIEIESVHKRRDISREIARVITRRRALESP